MKKFSTPFMAKSPLKQNGEDKKSDVYELSTKELMESVPGYNPRTGKVMLGGAVSAGGLGSGQSLSLLGKIGAGLAAGATAVAGLVRGRYARNRYKESQEKLKKQDAITDVYRSQGPRP